MKISKHTPTPKLFAYLNYITDSENFKYGAHGERFGDTPNFVIDAGSEDMATFIAITCNLHSTLIEALEKIAQGKLRPEINKITWSFADIVQDNCDIANEALAKARGES